MPAARLISALLIFGSAACAADDRESRDCPAPDCAACGDRAAWIAAPAEGATAKIGDLVTVTVGARSSSGLASVGYLALGELAGMPVQIAQETANGNGQPETSASFTLAVPFNANITRIVLIALAEDEAGYLRADAKAFVVQPYE